MTILEKERLVLLVLKFKNYKHFENYNFPLLNFIEDFADAVVGDIW